MTAFAATPEDEVKTAVDHLRVAIIKKDKAALDKDHCLADKAPETDKEQQVWRINKTNKGLKNVVVFLVPEQGTFFANSADDEAIKTLLGVRMPKSSYRRVWIYEHMLGKTMCHHR